MNPWAASDVHHLTHNTRLDWLWTTLYAQLRDMAVALPTPINLPHLPTDATPDKLARAANILERLRDTHLHTQDLPADIRGLADTALTDTILTAARSAVPAERRDLITEAQARVRAVTAYMGVGPEDMGVPDRLEDLTL